MNLATLPKLHRQVPARHGDTDAEVAMYQFLSTLKIPYISKHQVKVGDKSYELGILLVKHGESLCLEIDGPYHKIDKDAERDEALSKLGIETLRFTNKEALFLQRIAPRLQKLLRFSGEQGQLS